MKLMPFKEGDRVRLHSGADVGTVVAVPSTFRVLVRWDTGSHGDWRVNELVAVADDEAARTSMLWRQDARP